ncbi:hypothetical protein MMC21_005225 [Puttea exsequens]|nr:hypothetical protein [Puttea exsequens]
MLERQQSQLIAGLQEPYRCELTGEGWTAPRPEPTNDGQPLTHKILEGLGVFPPEEWEDSRMLDGEPRQRFEKQAHEMAASCQSSNPGPADTQSTSSLPSASHASFAKSIVMLKRRRRSDNDALNGNNLTICTLPPHVMSLSSTSSPISGQDNDLGFSTTVDFVYLMPAPALPFSLQQSFNDNISQHNLSYHNLGIANPSSRLSNLNPVWGYGGDDAFDIPSGQAMQMQVAS